MYSVRQNGEAKPYSPSPPPRSYRFRAGKTESVKALGQAFGRQVLVFNCDEGIDFKSMGRIFVGIVKCGAWSALSRCTGLGREEGSGE